MINPNEFRKSYGPWAVITGATDGTGSAFSRQLASVGINILLIARRVNLLNEVSEELLREYGVETRIASIDLYESGAGRRATAHFPMGWQRRGDCQDTERTHTASGGRGADFKDVLRRGLVRL